MKEKFQAINFPNGIEFNNKLFQSIGVNLENVENEIGRASCRERV